MFGYRLLKNSNLLSKISDINQILTTESLKIKEKCFSKYIFGSGIDHAEVISRQYLLMRLLGQHLNRALLFSLGKSNAGVVYYLPPEWRECIRKKGFKVSSFRTALQWNAFVAIMLAYGIVKIVKIIFNGIRAALKQSKQKPKNYVYFNALSPNTLPQPCKDGRSHDIISWYMQWDGRIKDIDMLCHDVINSKPCILDGKPVVPISSPIPQLAEIRKLLQFTVWGLGAIIIATLDFFRGYWWHSVLLNQAALAKQLRLQNPEFLAENYFFHNSSWIYRPLWTYEAERLGKRITFYFYSTNCENFKRVNAYPPPVYGYQAMNWPHYLVWDEYQADFVRRMVGESAPISIVGPIWLHTSSEEMPNLKGRSVAVFDITPFCSSIYQSMGIDFEFYVPKISKQFLHDIQEITNNYGYMMLWKRKRKLKNESSIVHPEYLFFAEKLSNSQNVIIVDSDISAFRVIEASEFVISMPFTSTALIARQLGKPSCYYDPCCLLQKDDRAAHGIEIIQGSKELKQWLNYYSCS